MRKTFLTLFFFVTAIMSAQDNKEQSKSQIVEASWAMPIWNGTRL
jgi:hypothetical protein